MRRLFPALLLTACVFGCATNSGAPGTAEADRPPEILFWTPDQRRDGFRTIERSSPVRWVKAGDAPLELGSSPRDLTEVTYEIDGESFTIAEFLQDPASIGLIVVQDGDVLFERYAPGNDESSRWISFSVTKSVTSMLIGAAIQDGFIGSVDEPVVHYLPRLRGTSYEETTIRNVLNMASGVRWNEDYADRASDVAKAGGANGVALVSYLADLPNDATPGDKFNYNTGETNLAGELLRAAIGNNASTYLTHKIWQPYGMEADAFWVLGAPGGGELGGCCINATLRDYARLGMFAMNGGQLADGTRVLPDGWMAESTAPSKGYDGYGYLWWLEGEGRYSARGIFGQTIRMDPSKRLVIAMHGNAPTAVGSVFHKHQAAALAALRNAID